MEARRPSQESRNLFTSQRASPPLFKCFSPLTPSDKPRRAWPCCVCWRRRLRSRRVSETCSQLRVLVPVLRRPGNWQTLCTAPGHLEVCPHVLPNTQHGPNVNPPPSTCSAPSVLCACLSLEHEAADEAVPEQRPSNPARRDRMTSLEFVLPFGSPCLLPSKMSSFSSPLSVHTPSMLPVPWPLHPCSLSLLFSIFPTAIHPIPCTLLIPLCLLRGNLSPPPLPAWSARRTPGFEQGMAA